MRLEDLMERAAKYDETLARDIKDYVHGRKYGLVYEASKPEFVRMWNKVVTRGDLVNILPPRGVMEDAKRDDDPSEIVYRVVNFADGIAKLRNNETGEESEASVGDIVALARFDKPIYAGLKEVDRVERGGNKPYHVVINGENYHALQTLIYAYQGKVDCIYIDPPYNTGASDWKYNNNYVSKDDQYRHSKWLTFMEDRLKLAKKLLNPADSVLIVTIDEKEYLRLGLLLEQLFPEARIQMVCSVINPAIVARDGEFGRSGEYLFYVFLGKSAPARIKLGREWVSMKGRTHTGTVRWDLLKRSGTGAQRSDSPGGFYPIYINPDNGKIEKIGVPLPEGVSDAPEIEGLYCLLPIRDDGSEGRWQWSTDSLREGLAAGRVKTGGNKQRGFTVYRLARAEYKKILDGEFEEIGRGINNEILVDEIDTEYVLAVPSDSWKAASHDSTQYGSRLLNNILTEKRFTFPKSLYAEKDSIKFVVANKPDAIIIDFFAGSGTTLHAVSLLNSEDGGNRHCICVTNNEVSVEEQEEFTNRGLRQGDDDWEKYGIARYVTWPRIRCAIEGIDVNGNPLKGDYSCPIETYREFEGEVIDPETGKKKRKKLYEKVKKPSYPELAGHKLSDGFEENVVFFDLEYLDPAIIGADLAYDSIAPILWMCGGCRGNILAKEKGYVIGGTYAVLFELRHMKRFVEILTDKPEVRTVFIVTDVAERYRSLCAELPGRDVRQLYESYLRSFEINAIG